MFCMGVKLGRSHWGRNVCRMWVFENMVLRWIFGPKKDEDTGEWTKLHNEELNVLYSSPNIARVIESERMRWAGHVARMGEERGVYKVLVRKSGGKRPLWRSRRRFDNNIKMDLQEVGCGGMGWIGLTQDRNRWRTLVSAVMNLGVPWNAGNFLTSWKPVSFSRRALHHGVSKDWVSPLYVGYSESKYRLHISLAHPRDSHFAHVQWLPLSIDISWNPLGLCLFLWVKHV